MRFSLATSLLFLLGTSTAIPTTPASLNLPSNKTLPYSLKTFDPLPPLTDTTFWSTLNFSSPTARADDYKVKYRCETSASSPRLIDVANCVMQLDHSKSPSMCTQGKDYGNFCEKMVSYRTAALDICGVPGWGWSPGCGDAPGIYAKIMGICKDYKGGDWRVGGFFRVVLPGWEGTRRDMNMYHT